MNAADTPTPRPRHRLDALVHLAWPVAAVAALVIALLLPSSSVPRPRELADQPVPRRLSYPWMSAAQWYQHHERLRAAAESAADNDPQAVRILWLGNSITEWWPRVGEDSWKRLWQPMGSLNLALGGDSSQHLLWRIRNGAIADGLQPRVVVVAIGTNNLHLSRHSNDQIIRGQLAVVDEIRRQLPAAGIVVSAILPRGHRPGTAYRKRILRINEAVAEALGTRPDVEFIDAGSQLLEPDGSIDRTIMRDYLHLTAEGYRRWAGQLLPAIQRFLPPAEGGISAQDP